MKSVDPHWLSVVRESVETLRYGVVQIVIHDSKVTQIDRTERTRITSNEASENHFPNQRRFSRPDTLEVS